MPRGVFKRISGVNCGLPKQGFKGHPLANKGKDNPMYGKPAWNRGKRLHYSIWNKGLKGMVKWTDEQRQKLSEIIKQRGANLNFYIDGKGYERRIERKRILKGVDYKIYRDKVFKRDSFRCLDCGEGGYLEVHHIIPYKVNKDKIYDINNGITLCRPCHRKTLGKELELANQYFSLLQVQ